MPTFIFTVTVDDHIPLSGTMIGGKLGARVAILQNLERKIPSDWLLECSHVELEIREEEE